MRKNINNKKKCCIKFNIFFLIGVKFVERKKNYIVKDNIVLWSEYWVIKCRVFIIGWVFVFGEKKIISGCI